MPITKTRAETFISDITSRPDDFVCDQFVVADTKTKREWWIANGGTFFDLYRPTDFTQMNVFDLLFWRLMLRGKCWRQFNAWKNAMADKTLSKGATS